jgi:enamine deaminase RidA (YjgF/YER057c/UK114 family)
MVDSDSLFNLNSQSPWEPLRGFSRAVRVKDHLWISGTTALAENGVVVGLGDAYTQTKHVLDTIKKVLDAAGFQTVDVVRTRMFVTDMASWKDYARAHSEIFDKIRPASSIVEVVKLVDPRLLVEIEADAILGASRTKTINI